MAQATAVTPTGKVWGLVTVTPLIRQITLGTVQASKVGTIQVIPALLHWPRSATPVMSVWQMKSWQSVSTTTPSISDPLAGPVITTDSEEGQEGSRQMVCSTTHIAPKVVVSMVCCC